MTKRVYIGRIELEFIVIADDSPEGRKAAAALSHKEFKDAVVWDEDFEIGRCSHLPGQYDLDSEVPVDGGGYMILSEAIKLPGGYAHKPASPSNPEPTTGVA